MQALAHFVVLLAEALFFLGLAGSAVVVAISFVEDLSELFSSDEHETNDAAPHTPHPARARPPA